MVSAELARMRAFRRCPEVWRLRLRKSGHTLPSLGARVSACPWYLGGLSLRDHAPRRRDKTTEEIMTGNRRSLMIWCLLLGSLFAGAWLISGPATPGRAEPLGTAPSPGLRENTPQVHAL